MSTPTRHRPVPHRGFPGAPLAGSTGRAARARAWLRATASRRSRLPSWWRWAAAGTAVVAVATGVWVVLFSSVLAVRTVEVVGEQQVTDEQVLAVAEVPVGTPLARLDVTGIEQRVAGLDAVAEVHVTRVWPDGVRIEVVERRPFAVIRTGSGFGVLGSDGVVFRSVRGPLPTLPLIDQQVGDAATEPAAAAALQVALALPPDLSRRVALVAAKSPDRVVLTLRNGSTVSWGTAEASAHKAQVLLLLLPLRAGHYDVAAPDAPVTQG
jgi:cell division protein FtsQ